jgi:cyclic dehypoxanthinyl futalosine synthase
MPAIATDEALLDKVLAGDRIQRDEALELYRMPLLDLGMLADRRRQLARGAAFDGRGN